MFGAKQAEPCARPVRLQLRVAAEPAADNQWKARARARAAHAADQAAVDLGVLGPERPLTVRAVEHYVRPGAARALRRLKAVSPVSAVRCLAQSASRSPIAKARRIFAGAAPDVAIASRTMSAGSSGRPVRGHSTLSAQSCSTRRVQQVPGAKYAVVEDCVTGLEGAATSPP